MQKISLELADNGVIKKITDDNINAAGETFESVVVYEIEGGNKNKIKFINELCVDVGVDFGNSRTREQIKIIEGWGDNYTPTNSEIKMKIESLSNEIQRLKGLIKP
jgi:hypothetical protein